MMSSRQETYRTQHCVPCEGKATPLTKEEAEERLHHFPGWQLIKDAQAIERTWVLTDFVTAMAFMNAVAECAEAENHHPDILLRYNRLTLTLSTHALHGLSENDFILAAKINAIPTLFS